ncbi:MAG TPA: hypothetical protein VGU01_07690 [Sphingomicrobium sp.]|nr:hypothetical protein [Sphingomicrobium sp.]
MARANSAGRKPSSPSSRSRNSRGTDRSGGVVDLARERPIAAVAVAASAAAAGLFLWSRRAQITDQISNLSDQIGEWTENMGSGSASELSSFGDDTGGLTTSGQASGVRSGGRASSRGMSETGSGNGSLGAVTGGPTTGASASGRGRARTMPSDQQ